MREAEIFIKSADGLSDKDDKEYMDSVFQVVLNENKMIFTKIREVPLMCEALRSLMQDVIDAEVNAAVDAAVDAALADKEMMLADKDQMLADKDAVIEAKDAEIARLKARLGIL